MTLNVLAIESYYGGSHKAFLDSWVAESEHQWTVLTLPAENWKSRIRHSAYHFASQANSLQVNYDVIFCSDLINLAELKSLLSAELRELPCVLYFHENQFSYPVHPPNQIDQHLAFCNLTSAVAADQIWWNSRFNQQQFLSAAGQYTQRFNDYDFQSYLRKIRTNSHVFSPGVDLIAPARTKTSVPTIGWAARWENDKAPHTFFKAMKILHDAGCEFKLNVMGEPGDFTPECFSDAQVQLTDHIHRWGYQDSREQYLSGLAEIDFFVSTAIHEFFGLSVVEAVLCGAYPVLPQRLAYPEVMQLHRFPERSQHFYQGGAPALAQHLQKLLMRFEKQCVWQTPQVELIDSFQRYRMCECAPRMDQQLTRLVSKNQQKTDQSNS